MRLAVEIATSLMPALPEIMSRLKNLFDLSARPDVIASHLSADDRLAGVAARCAGLRVPGAFDGFELAVRAILGQRVSVRAATTLAGRLAARFGEPVETPFAGLDRLSPTPARIADAPGSRDRRAGNRAPCAPASIRPIAQAVDPPRARPASPAPTPRRQPRALQAFPGIGDWTAQYIAMRALRWPDAFPAGDLGLLKAAGERSPQRLRERAEAWRPGGLTQPCISGNLSTLSNRRTSMTESAQVCYSVYSEPGRRVVAHVERRHADRPVHGPAAREAGPEPEARVAAG